MIMIIMATDVVEVVILVIKTGQVVDSTTITPSGMKIEIDKTGENISGKMCQMC